MKTSAKSLFVALLSAAAIAGVAADRGPGGPGHDHDKEHAKPDLTKLPPASDKKGLTFATDIEPLLKKSCVKCHSGDRPKSKYSMESLASIIKGGKEGKGILPGKSPESPVLLYAAETVEDMEMPPLDKREKFPALTKEQLGILRAWIDQGAK